MTQPDMPQPIIWESCISAEAMEAAQDLATRTIMDQHQRHLGRIDHHFTMNAADLDPSSDTAQRHRAHGGCYLMVSIRFD